MKVRTPEEMQAFESPPVGTVVQWFPQADVEAGRNPAMGQSPTVSAAIVTAVEGPGIVALNVMRRNSSIQYVQGCRHVTDPFHVKRGESTMRNGGWDFVPPYAGPSGRDYSGSVNRDPPKDKKPEDKKPESGKGGPSEPQSNVNVPSRPSA